MQQKTDNKMPSEIPLKEARYKFASDKLYKKATKAAAEARSLQKRQIKPTYNFENLAEDLQSSLANMQEGKSIREAMKDDVRNKLSSGELVASGYPIGGTGQAKKQQIEPEFWDNAEIDWDRGSASDHVAQYHRIRVAAADQAPVSEQASAADTTTKGTPGRPTKREMILEAIRVCDEADPEFSGMVGMLKKKRIWSQIQQANPDIKLEDGGFSDKTLEKYIRAYYKT